MCVVGRLPQDSVGVCQSGDVREAVSAEELRQADHRDPGDDACQVVLEGSDERRDQRPERVADQSNGLCSLALSQPTDDPT